ncbi:cytochrome C [Candidatus Poribacteria bacterium]|nr:cytochrome C [Candidatus Poribacteria bacterium]
MKIVVRVVLGLIVLALGAQLYRPLKTNPPTDPSRTLQAQMTVPPNVTAILDRACRDCHSNDTKWPWYADVAPVMWSVRNHVNFGRKHLNMSDWAQYSQEDAAGLLDEICEEVREHKMPLPAYLPMHPQAKLSQADIDALCEWALAANATLGGGEHTHEEGEEHEH